MPECAFANSISPPLGASTQYIYIYTRICKPGAYKSMPIVLMQPCIDYSVPVGYMYIIVGRLIRYYTAENKSHGINFYEITQYIFLTLIPP